MNGRRRKWMSMALMRRMLGRRVFAGRIRDIDQMMRMPRRSTSGTVGADMAMLTAVESQL
jgi:hypothetical protein